MLLLIKLDLFEIVFSQYRPPIRALQISGYRVKIETKTSLMFLKIIDSEIASLLKHG